VAEPENLRVAQFFFNKEIEYENYIVYKNISQEKHKNLSIILSKNK
jgi:hypothetical protein